MMHCTKEYSLQTMISTGNPSLTQISQNHPYKISADIIFFGKLSLSNFFPVELQK